MNKALVQVLGAVAYGEWKAYEGAKAAAAATTDEALRRRHRKVAAEELRHHKGFVARLEAHGADPERAMRPFREALDRYHAHTRPIPSRGRCSTTSAKAWPTTCCTGCAGWSTPRPRRSSTRVIEDEVEPRGGRRRRPAGRARDDARRASSRRSRVAEDAAAHGVERPARRHAACRVRSPGAAGRAHRRLLPRARAAHGRGRPRTVRPSHPARADRTGSSELRPESRVPARLSGLSCHRMA